MCIGSIYMTNEIHLLAVLLNLKTEEEEYALLIYESLTKIRNGRDTIFQNRNSDGCFDNLMIRNLIDNESKCKY